MKMMSGERRMYQLRSAPTVGVRAPPVIELSAKWSNRYVEDVDIVDEDLLGSDKARATGFVGRSSEVQW
jgi:hypothetical protein